MSIPVDPKDPNLAMALTLQIAATAIKIRDIEMRIAANPGMLDDSTRERMAESLQRVQRACDALHSSLVIDRDPKAQDWGPCAKCGGRYRFETLGPYGMDAFKVTKIICTECGFTVNWHDDPDRDAPMAWQHARTKTASEKLAKTMDRLKASPPPTLEEVDTQMKSSAKFREEQDERRNNDKR